MIAHIVGTLLTVDDRFCRQRCMWCGAILIQEDLHLLQSVDESPPRGFPPNVWVETDGFVMQVVENLVEGQMPLNACMRKMPDPCTCLGSQGGPDYCPVHAA